jgi:hypothetical protein
MAKLLDPKGGLDGALGIEIRGQSLEAVGRNLHLRRVSGFERLAQANSEAGHIGVKEVDHLPEQADIPPHSAKCSIQVTETGRR